MSLFLKSRGGRSVVYEDRVVNNKDGIPRIVENLFGDNHNVNASTSSRRRRNRRRRREFLEPHSHFFGRVVITTLKGQVDD